MPHSRPFARCLPDRGYIYRPNPTPGGKPVAVGHTCSLPAFLPERERASSPPWVVFLDARRVATDQNAAPVAQEQVSRRNLLVTAYQTPDVGNEERWWRVVLLAAFLLWLARDVAQGLPRPWERYLYHLGEGKETAREVSPSHVQRDMGRIIGQLGTPARRLQPRGKPVGRPKGMHLTPAPGRKWFEKELLRAHRRPSGPIEIILKVQR